MNLYRWSILFLLVAAVSRLSFGGTVPVTGYAYSFYSNDPISDATISICRTLNQSCVETKTDDNGEFVVDSFQSGEEIYVQIEKHGFQSMQTANFTIPAEGLMGERKIVLQVPGWIIYKVFTTAIWANEYPQYCHVAGTVLAAGKTHNDLPHGREGVTVFAKNCDDPAVTEADYYFGIFDWDPLLLTYKTNPLSWFRTDTSSDGGFLFYNLTPGRYQISAKRDGETFSHSIIECRAGAFINLSPPHGPVQISEAL